MPWTKNQWPHAITTGDIRYHRVPKNCGMGEWYALSDDSHGIPVFGSVRETEDGSTAHIFNYPGQTEQIAAELVKRWNAYPKLLAEIAKLKGE